MKVFRGLGKPVTGVIGMALAAVGWYSWRVETRWLRTVRLTLPVPDLPPAFDGYRIAHISDLHLGVPLIQRHLPEVVQAVTRERPDVLAITGDFGTGDRDGLAEGLPVLSGFRAPDGAWGVLGNHDYYVGVDAVETLLHKAGIGLLRNTHHVVRRGPDQLVIAGVDDVIYGIPNLRAALDGVPNGSPVILLAHEPDFARIALSDSRIVLQLSGHTHGGQIRLPRMQPFVLPKMGHLYPAGAYRIDGLALNVTTGTGTGRFVMRFNCRPEIAVITLVRGTCFSANGQYSAWRVVPRLKKRRRTVRAEKFLSQV